MPDIPRRGGSLEHPLIQAALRQALAEEDAAGVADVERQIAEHRAGQAQAAAQIDPAELAASNQRVRATPAVRVLANRERVHLADVRGTGPGGQITLADVQAAAVRRPVPQAVAGARFPHATAQTVNVRATYDGWLAAARALGPEPTLFTTGDLPPFTASGIEVSQLMLVPWQARPPMAAAPTRAAALAVVQKVLNVPDPEVYAGQLFRRHDVVEDYLAAVSQWLEAGQHQLRMQAVSYPGPRVVGE